MDDSPTATSDDSADFRTLGAQLTEKVTRHLDLTSLGGIHLTPQHGHETSYIKITARGDMLSIEL